MVLSIKSQRADDLARELAHLTGKSITDVVVSSLESELATERRKERDLTDIVDRFSLLLVLDDRPADEILGYDDSGVPS